eukprot:scaffold18.g1893.t1
MPVAPDGSSSDEEAFVGQEEGQIEGQVLADLEGGQEPPGSGDEEEEGGSAEVGEEGGGAGPSGDDHDMGEDDSLHTWEGHAGGVYAVAWSPVAPDTVATGGGDDKAFVWRVGQDAFEATGGAFLELAGHADTVGCLGFSGDGALLATGGMDGRVKVWEPATGRCAATLEGPGDAVEWLAWHPRGNILLAGAADFTAWMWLAQTGACMQVFIGHSGPVTCGGFTPDGKLVVTGGGEGDASLRVWSPKTGACSLTVAGHPYHTAGLTSLDLHPDSTAAISGSEDGTAKVVNLHSGRVVATLAGHAEDSSVEGVAFSRHLPAVAMSGGLDGALIAWDVATAQPRATCQHPEGVTRLVEHPTQPLVVTGCMDGGVRCWDERTGACVRTWRGHRDAVQALAVSADGRLVMSGSEDQSARVFSLE